MATTSRAKTDTAETPASAFRLPSFERATERIRNLNKEVITSSKKAGTVTLEVYEKSLNSLGRVS